MSLVRHGNSRRALIAFWLLLYAAAGMLVYSPLGHNHWHRHSAEDGTLTCHTHEHSHFDAGHSQAGHVDEHSTACHHHPVTASECDLPTPVNSPDDDHNHQHNHDSDCAGCQLLGSISAPTPQVTLAECGRLVAPVVLLNVSCLPASLVGVHLARAPPVL